MFNDYSISHFSDYIVFSVDKYYLFIVRIKSKHIYSFEIYLNAWFYSPIT